MVAPARLGAGVARFVAERTFVAITARDTDGTMWLPGRPHGAGVAG
jgi:hypothetical protein